MANIRIGLGSEFNLKNSNLGINTATPQQRLDVAGVAKAKDLKVTGVSSLTAYEGFLRSDNQIDESINLEFGNGINASLSGEIIVGTGVTVTIGLVGVGTTGVGIGTSTILKTVDLDTTDVNIAGGSQIECLKVYNTFTPPNGGTNERPYAPKPGELYYNFDFKTIEFYDGYGWRQVDNTTRSGRGLFNLATPDTAQIDFINISSQGNAQDFGNISLTRHHTASFASEIRGLWAGGYISPAASDRIDYVTIASEGNAIDFGNLAPARYGATGCSSSTRGIMAGGNAASPYAARNEIDYVEIATLGDAVDFGTLSIATDRMGGCSSPTRGIFAGGSTQPVSSYVSKIEYIIIASKGNGVDTGYDLTERRQSLSGASNSVRGIFRAGQNETAPNNSNTIDYITLASLGNAIDFGDATIAVDGGKGVANSTRAVFAGGETNPAGPAQNIIEFVTIASTGNAQDFGDLTRISRFPNACSDSHGGLGGF